MPSGGVPFRETTWYDLNTGNVCRGLDLTHHGVQCSSAFMSRRMSRLELLYIAVAYGILTCCANNNIWIIWPCDITSDWHWLFFSLVVNMWLSVDCCLHLAQQTLNQSKLALAALQTCGRGLASLGYVWWMHQRFAVLLAPIANFYGFLLKLLHISPLASLRTLCCAQTMNCIPQWPGIGHWNHFKQRHSSCSSIVSKDQLTEDTRQEIACVEGSVERCRFDKCGSQSPVLWWRKDFHSKRDAVVSCSKWLSHLGSCYQLAQPGASRLSNGTCGSKYPCTTILAFALCQRPPSWGFHL